MKLIILDRDGVINQDSDQYIKSPDEWIPLPGSLEAISLLNQHGYTVAIATNQSGIARGFYSENTLQQMHEKMTDLLIPINGRVDGIFYCPHGPDDNCDCRKPKPGLYHQIAKHFNTALDGVNIIGDSYRDLDAAMAVNAKPILVKTGKGLVTLKKHEDDLKRYNIPIFDDLKCVVDKLLSENS
ncbi:MAG: D-glycero-beta-D-manno-heptose 1,7-bisphosphate 7-phosphatase [Gammaproteobacteria bacterium]|nr:D-glycero-beta-D-manno-heptose 1,7-bisphosphate 7-phosphatase [Gammaproteobacteria bacterium]